MVAPRYVHSSARFRASSITGACIQTLKRLVNLEYFGLLETTTVADGDLATLLTLPKLKHATIRDRQDYNVRNSELPKAYRHANKVTVLYQE